MDDAGPPIATPSVCLWISPLKIKNVVCSKIFNSSNIWPGNRFVQSWRVVSLISRSLMTRRASVIGMLVYRDSTSKDTMISSGSIKGPIPTEKKHNIIYKLDCKDCDAVYIGESKRAYQTRIGEHISAVQKADTRWYGTADHCWKFNHDFNWTENKILGHELNTTTRKIKETIHSIKTEITSMESPTSSLTSGYQQ